MKLHHFDPLAESCALALCVIRFATPKSAPERKAMAERLAAAGAFAPSDSDDDDADDHDCEHDHADDHDHDHADPVDDQPSAFVTGIWVPRTPEGHAAAIDSLRTLQAEAAWLLALDTTIDAIAAAQAEQSAQAEGEGDDDDDDVLAADAHGDDDDDDDDIEDDDDDETSHWRFGPPPSATAAPFALERYPAILEEFDWEDFGIALKLAQPPTPGERHVLTAFHQLWVSAYVDPRADEVPFRNTAVTFDATHRSALVWIDRFCPPATIAQMVHHLVWIANRIHEIVPVAHARFAEASMEQKYHHMIQGAPPPFVLAGNPLAARYYDDGEAAALAWAEAQAQWSRKELAAMLVELGTDFDPDEPEPSATATRLFDRAAALDPDNDDAESYAMQALVRSGRVDQALGRARASDAPSMRGFTFGLIAEHASDRLRDALDLLDATTLDGIAEEKVGEIVASVATRLPDALPRVLAAVPRTSEMIGHLYNAAHQTEDLPVRMQVLDVILDLPVPDDGQHRAAYTFAINNACVHAHAMQDYARASALADRAQAFAEENPYIFHSAACAYVAVGELDKAMAQVERAIARDYDHLDKLEVDTDLGELLKSPRFVELFAERRERIARSEPVREVDTDAFADAVLAADRPVLVDFTATWCGPCRRQSPILERLAQSSAGRFRIVKVDIDESPDLAQRYEARSVPTLVVFRDGQEVARTVGLSEKSELEAMLAQAGVQ